MKMNHEDTEEDLMAKCLYVDVKDDEDDEEETAPKDGLDYLRKVIKERRRVPDTVTATSVPPRMAAAAGGAEKSKPRSDDGRGGGGGSVAKRTKLSPPPGCCPGPAWQREQVAEFSEVRQRLGKHAALVRTAGGKPSVRTPDKKREADWCRFCLGEAVWREVRAAREDVEEEDIEKDGEAMGRWGEAPPQDPLVAVITALPVHVVESVLEYAVGWLEGTGWRRGYGPWLYSLLARLEKPLTPDTGSLLRDLALACSRERRRIYREKGVGGGGGAVEGEEPDPDMAALNLFICLVAKYFDQGDLADREESESE